MNTAPRGFRVSISRSLSCPGLWDLSIRQQTSAGAITVTEYRYPTRAAATREALSGAYVHAQPVREWPITIVNQQAEADAWRYEGHVRPDWL